ncbi:hypothetical protein NIES4074_65930 [Cylindrospermum sp. NIES-4074]|nr:hypothetical protein NIES4074_65930 [Cylindrospermum sp. NIES-4074]
MLKQKSPKFVQNSLESKSGTATRPRSSRNPGQQTPEPTEKPASDFTLLYKPQLAKALRELRVTHPAEAAIFLNQLAFWMKTSAGHITRDGRKWIYNSYQDWTEQIANLTSWQMGKMIRQLVELGLIEKSCYAHVRHDLLERPPVAWHTDNTSSWMTLNVEQIVELTDWHPFGEEIKPQQSQNEAQKQGISCAGSAREQEREIFPSAPSPQAFSLFPQPIASAYFPLPFCPSTLFPQPNPTPAQILVENPPLNNQRLKPLSSAEIANTISRSCESYFPILRSQFPSIYRENLSLYQIHEIIKEKDEAINTTYELPDPWTDEPDNVQDSLDVDEQYLESLESIKDTPEDHSSAAPLSEIFTEFESYTNTESSHQDYSNPIASSQGFLKAPKLRTNKRTKETTVSPHFQEIWEMEPHHPYSIFLNWWADKKYKPQGGKWEADAYGNAYAEFYNNRHKTTVVLFPQFLAYMQQVAQNCDQQLANGIKAILPSCFVTRPDATPENVRQLMENFQELIDRGAQVALPTNYATPANTQSMSFTAATDSQNIPPLPKLEQPALPTSEPLVADDKESLLQSLARNQAKWKNIPRLRPQVEEWVNQTLGVEMTPDGPILVSDAVT